MSLEPTTRRWSLRGEGLPLLLPPSPVSRSTLCRHLGRVLVWILGVLVSRPGIIGRAGQTSVLLDVGGCESTASSRGGASLHEGQERR